MVLAAEREVKSSSTNGGGGLGGLSSRRVETAAVKNAQGWAREGRGHSHLPGVPTASGRFHAALTTPTPKPISCQEPLPGPAHSAHSSCCSGPPVPPSRAMSHSARGEWGKDASHCWKTVGGGHRMALGRELSELSC